VRGEREKEIAKMLPAKLKSDKVAVEEGEAYTE
jgi:hypothetical protein